MTRAAAFARLPVGIFGDASGNIGIGTSSPSGKLNVYGSGQLFNLNGGGTSGIYATIGSTGASFIFGTQNSAGNGPILGATGAYDSILGTQNATNQIFITNNVERMRIDSVGNVGIGLAASSWGSAYKAIQLPSGALFSNNNGAGIYLTQNTYYNGTNWIASTTAPSTIYTQSQGTHQFFTASPVTGGTAASPVECMRIDALGYTVMGTGASGTYRLTVNDSAAKGATGYPFVLSSNEASSQMQLVFQRSTNTGFTIQSVEQNIGYRDLYLQPSSGNVLIGTIDWSIASGAGIKFVNGGGNPYMGIVGASSTNAANSYHLYSTGAGAYRFYVGYDGVIHATSATISAISDQRLKENVRDLDVGLNEILTLRPRRFDWREGKGLNKKNDVGFIAQEFETVFPNSVAESLAGEDGIAYKAVSQSELIPTLVKAIQEQQAIIEGMAAKLKSAGIAGF